MLKPTARTTAGSPSCTTSWSTRRTAVVMTVAAFLLPAKACAVSELCAALFQEPLFNTWQELREQRKREQGQGPRSALPRRKMGPTRTTRSGQLMAARRSRPALEFGET